jgi:hypothetical protein
MMSLLGKEKEPTSKKIPPPTNEVLKVERKRAARQDEEKFLQHIQQVLTEPHKRRKLVSSKMRRIFFPQTRPKRKTL